MENIIIHMEENKMKKFEILKCAVIIFVVLVVIVAIKGNGEEQRDGKKEVSTEEHGVSNVEVKKNVGISDFKYELSGKKVKLTGYSGNDKILEIKSSYKIDGKKYKTDLLDFQIGIGDGNVETVIFCKGIKKVNNAIFNSCDVQKVYFPKSIKVVYDKTLSYLHPEDKEKVKIYYEGTQKEWEKIFKKYKRKNVGDSKTGEEAGVALADKVNEMIGSGYDSSEFEYFFSTSPDDLK